jgi:hypothetical protein
MYIKHNYQTNIIILKHSCTHYALPLSPSLAHFRISPNARLRETTHTHHVHYKLYLRVTRGSSKLRVKVLMYVCMYVCMHVCMYNGGP